MRLRITSGGVSTEAWTLTDRVVWSGSKSRAARGLEFGLLVSTGDPGQPAVDCPLGAQAELLDDNGEVLFLGIVVARTAATGDALVGVTAMDRGIYLANNDGTYVFRGTTPEAGVRQMCEDYGIPVGDLAATGISVRRKFAGVSLWDIASTLYTLAAEQNGKRYMVRFRGGGLTVAERTESAASVVIRPGSNLRGASTTESIEAMRNSVAIYDSSGNLIQTIEDEDARALYGLMQEHLTQREGEDAAPEARAILEDNGVAQSVTVTCSGDTRIITGETVAVEDPETGLTGIFWVDADTHTWQGGDYTLRLTLNCRNVIETGNSGSEVDE